MRRFEMSSAEEARSKTIQVPEEEVEGWIKGSLRGLGRSGMQYFGYEKSKMAKTEVDDGILE